MTYFENLLHTTSPSYNWKIYICIKWYRNFICFVETKRNKNLLKTSKVMGLDNYAKVSVISGRMSVSSRKLLYVKTYKIQGTRKKAHYEWEIVITISFISRFYCISFSMHFVVDSWRKSFPKKFYFSITKISILWFLVWIGAWG